MLHNVGMLMVNSPWGMGEQGDGAEIDVIEQRRELRERRVLEKVRKVGV